MLSMDCSVLSVDLYIGETKGQLNKRMNGHRSEINHAGNQILYQPSEPFRVVLKSSFIRKNISPY